MLTEELVGKCSPSRRKGDRARDVPSVVLLLTSSLLLTSLPVGWSCRGNQGYHSSRLGYLLKPGVVSQPCNPRSLEAETRGLQVGGQPGISNDILS